MVSHYLFEVEFCNPASGWEKGQVEKNVQRRSAPAVAADAQLFPTLDALNDVARGALQGAMWAEITHGKFCPARWPMCGPAGALQA